MTRATDRVPAAKSEIDPYLQSVIDVLWPSTEVRLTGRRRRGGTGSRFVAIPSALRPKLLVPSRPRRAAAGALRHFKTAASRREQAQLALLSFGGRLGAHDLLPGQVVVTPGPAGSFGIEAELHKALDRPVNISLYIGPARAVRKPILQVMDDAGRTFAFAKLGVDTFTDNLIDVEAAAVAQLAAANTQVLRVPELLYHGEWNGHPLIVQSAFRRGASPSVNTAVVGQAVREIAEARGVTRGPLGRSAYWARLTERVEALGDGVHPDRLRRALDEVTDAHANTSLEYGSWHGDFAPWNMTASADHLRVWDWEKFEDDVPVGFDLVHFAVQGAVVGDGMTPDAAFVRAGHLAPAVLATVGNARAARLVVQLYAVDIATRYLTDREQDAGQTRMTDLANWLGAVLDDAARTS